MIFKQIATIKPDWKSEKNGNKELEEIKKIKNGGRGKGIIKPFQLCLEFENFYKPALFKKLV